MGKPWWPRRPFGYEQNGDLREIEAQAIRAAYSTILAGGSLSSVTKAWNKAGLVSNRGNAWRSTTVRGVLTKARNAGLRTHNGVEVGPGDWQAIVPEETWRAAVRIMGRPERSNRGGGERRHLLTGVAVCGVCGHAVGGNTRTRSAGTYAVYECKGKYCISHRMEAVDEVVQAYAILLLTSEVFMRRSLASGGHGEEAAALREELAVLRERADEIAEMVGAGEFTREQGRKANAVNTDRMAEIESKLDRLTGESALSVWFAGTKHDQRKAGVEAWYRLSVEDRRKLVTMLFSKVELQRRGRGVRDFVPARDLVVLDHNGNRVGPKHV
jgi:hypothetical protein